MTNDVKVEVEADKLEEFLNNIGTKMQKASTGIIEDLANLALSEIQSNYSRSEYQPGETMDFLKTGTDKEKTVSMAGPQAWYSEFGTGTRGAVGDAHPLKRKFGLNPYNSGETIRTASEEVTKKSGIPTGTLYWTYKADDGEIYYTQGIPAQKQVYNAGQTVQKEIPEISMKHMKEMFK